MRLQALSKHWKLAVFLFVLTMLTAAALAFLRKPVYESGVTLVVGSTGDGYMVESPSAVMNWLRVQYGLTPWHRERKMPRLESVGYGARQDKKLIALRAVAHTPAEARDFLADIGRATIDRHHPIFERLRAPVIARTRALESEIATLHSQIKSLAPGGMENADPYAMFSAVMERASLLEALLALKQRKVELELRLSRALPTRLLTEPTLPEVQTRPRPVPILVSGMIVGLFVALAGVVAIERRNAGRGAR